MFNPLQCTYSSICEQHVYIHTHTYIKYGYTLRKFLISRHSFFMVLRKTLCLLFSTDALSSAASRPCNLFAKTITCKHHHFLKEEHLTLYNKDQKIANITNICWNTNCSIFVGILSSQFPGIIDQSFLVEFDRLNRYSCWSTSCCIPAHKLMTSCTEPCVFPEMPQLVKDFLITSFNAP